MPEVAVPARGVVATPVALALLATLLSLAPTGIMRAQAPAAPTALPDSVRTAVDRVFLPWARHDAPGCAVGVSRNGAVVYEAGFGMANLEHDVPITPASIFHVASISKQFTAAAIMLLAHDGRLSLDDEIQKYLPEVPRLGDAPITIRHLLHHTSGWRDQWDLIAMSRGRFEEDRITEDDVLEIVARQRGLNFAPGTEYLYSNTGYTLAGTIVRRVSGKSLREFADERIFRPLGMSATHFHDDYTMIVPGRAAGYARRPNGSWRVSLPNFDTYGATSLFTTAGDLLRWEANLDRPTVGDAAMVREMERSAVLANGDTTGYGLGLASGEYRGARLVGHGGADAGYRSYVGRFPAQGVAIAVACNASTANPQGLAMGVADAVLGSALSPNVPRRPPVAAATPAAADLQKLAGTYANVLTGATLRFLFDGTTFRVAGGPPLVAVAPGRFRAADGDLQEAEFTAAPGRELLLHSGARPPRQPQVFRRVNATRPTAAAMRAYAGTYASEELGATYTVTADDSTIVLKTRRGESVRLPFAYEDTFAGRFIVTFTRSRGAIDGFRMSSGRVRGVRFTRTTSTAGRN
jgi:CubicO group peptidase (beta-lactamase class C family)